MCGSRTKNMNKNHIGTQSQDVESPLNSFDGIICLDLEADSKNMIEEAPQSIRFRGNYDESPIQEAF
jgi:hypothetical protein